MAGQPMIDGDAKAPSLIAKVAATTVMTAVVFCIALQVLNRYVAHIQVSWTEEVSRLLLVWVASIGAILAVSARTHFRMELLTGLLSPRMRRAIDTFISLATLIFLAFFLYSGIRFCMDLADNRSQMLGIPYAYPMVALPIAAAGMFVAVILRIAATRRERSDRK